MNASRLRNLMFLSIAGNLLLTFVKLAVGWLVASAALVADGIHSLSDLLTDFVAWAGIRLSRRPPDTDHPYGHGRFETMATLFIALVLLYVAWEIFFHGLVSLYRHEEREIGLPVLAVALASVLLKEWLFRLFHAYALARCSPAMLANAWHHRSDALSSIAVALGALAALTGFGHGDQVASIVVGLMIAHSAWTILRDTLAELTDAAVDRDILESVRRLLEGMDEVRGFHKIRSRRVGGEVFIDLHIQVDPLLSVRASHSLTGEIKERLRSDCNIPLNLLIHVEPEDESPEKGEKGDGEKGDGAL